MWMSPCDLVGLLIQDKLFEELHRELEEMPSAREQS